MATNADNAADDSKEVTEDDLRDLKYGNDGVENSKETDETTDTDEDKDDSEDTGDDDANSDDKADDGSDDDDSSDDDSDQFVKELPGIKGDTIEEYARNLEKAYNGSTTEALRLKKLVDEANAKDTEIGDDGKEDKADTNDPVTLFMKQKMDEEITKAYTDFAKSYPQVADQLEYNKFTHEVAVLSQTILQSQKRLAPPAELYSKAAVILGWEPDAATTAPTDKERLNDALKNSASTSKTSSATKRSSKSKVTDAMVAANRRMYPEKTDAQIREELEPYV